MRYRLSLIAFSLFAFAFAALSLGQTATPTAATAATVVPHLVRYAGTALLPDGKAAMETSIKFAIFKDERGGEPLWVETQPVTTDATGRYEVHLGATSASGLPDDLFSSGEARWLEVQVGGSKPRLRVLLASVPYAMKAADAATLGGLPASAFVLAGTKPAEMLAQPAGITPDAGTTVTTTGGTTGYLPVYSGASTIDDSLLFQSGTKVGIGTAAPAVTLDVNGSLDVRGPLTMTNSGTATSSAGADSHSLQFTASSYNSTSKAARNATFSLQAEPANNNSIVEGATLNLLYGVAATPAETGFKISSAGLLSFAAGQTFNSSASSGNAISGTSSSGDGVAGTSSTGDGVLGDTGGSSLGTAGVLGVAGSRNTDGFSGIAGVWGDSSAHVGVLGTSNQYAGVEGISNSGQGLLGQSTSSSGVQGTSSSGTGVAGSSTTADGVLGYTAGNTLGTAGVFGVAGPRTNFNGIAAVWGDSAAHVGVYGSSTQYAGVYGSSTNGNGIQGYSANGTGGDFQSSGQTATVTATNAATGPAFSAIANGVNAQAIQATSNGEAGVGVEGIATGSLGGQNISSIGVFGYSATDDTNLESIGVEGFSPGNGTGVLGMIGGASQSGQNFYGAAVEANTNASGDSGTVAALLSTADDNIAAYMINNSNNWTTLQLVNSGSGGVGPNLSGVLRATGANGSSCGIGTKGDLTCTGQVKTLSRTSNARVIETYAMQSAENWIEDFGTSTLQNGSATVVIDSAFTETANTGADYHVFLTPRGDSMGLYVSHVSATGFGVHEAAGGTTSMAFEYRIVAKRRGYEAQRFSDVTERFQLEAALANRQRTPLKNGSARKASPRLPKARTVMVQPPGRSETSALREHN